MAKQREITMELNITPEMLLEAMAQGAVEITEPNADDGTEDE
jgi:hypothetical protein